MEEDEIQKWLKEIPGARRGANGIIVGDERGHFYITNVIKRDNGLESYEDFFDQFCAKKEILRLRSIRNAHDYLLRIRANAVADSARLTRVMAARRKRYEANGRVWTLSAYYDTLNGPPKRYLERLPRKLRKAARTVPFGFTPTLEANAMCFKSVVGEIITVSEALRYFFYFMTICFHGGHYGFDYGDQIDAALIAVRTMIGSESQDFDIDPRAVLPPHVEASIQRDVDSMIEFTFGHEFSHLLLGHMTDAHDEAVGSEALKTYGHGLEFAADNHAVIAIVNDDLARRRICEAGYHVFLYLHLMELLSDAHEEIPRFSVSKTHPPPLSRIDALHDSLAGRRVLSKVNIREMINQVRSLSEDISERIADQDRSDFLTFYGSIYLRALGGRIREDRVDF